MIRIIILMALFQLNLAERKLEFVQMIFRHGDRAPNKLPYPTDPYTEEYWPNGWEQLTELGFSQMRARGQYFRNRYSNFLGQDFDSSQFLLLSSPINRSIISAQAFVSGFLDNCSNDSSQTRTIPNCNKLVKLCNVTNPTDQYPNIGYQPACKRFSDAQSDLLLKEKARVEEKYSDVIQFLQGITGKPDFDNKDLARSYHVQKEMFHNLTQPDWVFKRWPNHQNRSTHEIAEEVYLAHLYNSYGANEISKFVAGTILSDFLKNAQKVVAGTQPKKFVAYSSHDTVIMALMSLFGVFDMQLPAFGATFIMEVYSEIRKDRKIHEVQLSYLSLGTEPVILQIPGYDNVCPMDNFITIYENKGYKNELEKMEVLVCRSPMNVAMQQINVRCKGYTPEKKEDTSYTYKCLTDDRANEIPEVNITIDGDVITCYRNTYNNGSVDCFCGTNLCNSIDSPAHKEILKIADNITEHKYLECHEGLHHKSGFVSAVVGCTQHETVCNIGYVLDGSYMQKCDKAPTKEGLFIYTDDHIKKLNATCFIDHVNPSSLWCVCHTHRCNAIGGPIHQELQKIVDHYAKRLKCNFGFGRELYKPYECNHVNDKCWMGYTGNKNTDSSYTYSCKTNNRTEAPEIKVNIKGNEITCYRNTDGHVDCFCGTNLCNSIDSSTHDEILKIVDNITEHKYLECYDGLHHKSGFTISPAVLGCTKNETVCNLGYSFDGTLTQKCDEANVTKGLFLYADRKLRNHNETCFFDEKMSYIWCTCHTHRCNAIGSLLHEEMVKIVEHYSGQNISGIFNVDTVDTTNLTPSERNDNRSIDKTIDSVYIYEKPNGATGTEEQTSPKNGSPKTTLSTICIFVFSIVVSRTIGLF